MSRSSQATKLTAVTGAPSGHQGEAAPKVIYPFVIAELMTRGSSLRSASRTVFRATPSRREVAFDSHPLARCSRRISARSPPSITPVPPRLGLEPGSSSITPSGGTDRKGSVLVFTPGDNADMAPSAGVCAHWRSLGHACAGACGAWIFADCSTKPANGSSQIETAVASASSEGSKPPDSAPTRVHAPEPS